MVKILKMKKQIFTILLSAFCVWAFGQVSPLNKHFTHQMAPKKRIPAEIPSVPMIISSPLKQIKERNNDVVLTTQKYDLQTYNSMPNRVWNFGNDFIGAGWMYANDEFGGWSDRGTGISRKVNGAWENFERAEDLNIRTGFPSSCGLEDGSVVAIAHQNTSAPPYNLRLMKKAKTATSWAASLLPVASKPGNQGYIWPVITSGGMNGNTLHVIAINNAPDAARQLHYFRSQDGGATWDISEKILPGLDTSWISVDAHVYSIHARGNTVAIGVFDPWGDVTILKSTDNGATWTKFIALDFPLDNYIADTGYSEDDIKSDHPTLTDEPLAIYTADGGGTVHIDKNNMVHAFFGDAFVIDTELGDGFTSYFTNVSGISYWNESYGKDSVNLIADLWDADGDGEFTVNGTMPTYFGHGLTSFPSVGSDDAGNLYMAYAAVAEGFYNPDVDKMYRHIFLTSSKDKGQNWSDPYDVINKVNFDPLFADILEGVYPSLAPLVDGKVHLVFQQDYQPGSYIAEEQDELQDNNIVYLGIDKNIVLKNTELVDARTFDLSVVPNPANDRLTVKSSILNNKIISAQLIDVQGKVVRTLHEKPFEVLSESATWNLSAVQNGLYFLKIYADQKEAYIKIMIQH